MTPLTRQVRSSPLPYGALLQARPPYSPGFPPAAVLVFDTIALLFIGLIAVAGFTVLAQRRLRALGMLQAVGATDRHVRLVLIANGAVVGIIAAVTGTVVALAGWVAFVPRLETIVEHRIATFSLPWWEVAAAIVLAVVTAVAAAWWPARAAAHVPVVAALSGRPATPKQGRRPAALGGALLAVGLAAIALSHQGKTPPLIIGGLVLTAAGVLLLGPIAIGGLAVLGRRSPLAIRLALRDLARYRARSGAALAAISLVTGIVAAIAISAAAAAQNEGLAGEAGWANLPANQLMVYLSPGGSQSLPAILPQLSASRLHHLEGVVGEFGSTLHSQDVVPLEAAESADSAGAADQPGQRPADHHARDPGVGPRWPAGLDAGGAAVRGDAGAAEVLRDRPGSHHARRPTSSPRALGWAARRSWTSARMRARASGHCGAPNTAPGRATRGPAAPYRRDLARPSIQLLGLPKYASAPNTLLTAHAMTALALHPVLAAWLIQTPKALTAAQVTQADHWAAANGLTVETTSHSAQAGLQSVSDWAIAIGVLAVLAVLAMTVGLIRSETAGDLRVLSATGASGGTRRLLTGRDCRARWHCSERCSELLRPTSASSPGIAACTA